MQRIKRLFLVGNETQYGRDWLIGVHNYCRAHGRWEYHLEGDITPGTARQAQNILRKWNPHGIIADMRNRHIEELVRGAKLPSVNIGRNIYPDVPTVTSDYQAMGRIGARHFLDNGFKNFGFFADTFAPAIHAQRLGFAEELAAAGFECSTLESHEAALNDTGFSWLRFRRKAEGWLRSLRKPVAILCNHVLRAQEISALCRRLGLYVPDEVAIVGMGAQEILCEMSVPPLSSIAADLQRIGYEGARLLDRMLHGAAPPSEPILVSPRQVVARQSSDIIALEDADTSAAVRFIRNNVDRPFGVNEILQKIPISRRILEQRFRKFLGRTPRQEILRVHMEHAKNLLIGTDLPIPMVAMNSGFTSHDIFSVCFRRQMGITPSQYRRSRSSPIDESSTRNGKAQHTDSASIFRRDADVAPSITQKQRRHLVELTAPLRPGSRVKPAETREIILSLCQDAYLTPAQIGQFLHRNPLGLRERFLRPLTRKGLLQRKYPKSPNRPDQAYMTKSEREG